MAIIYDTQRLSLHHQNPNFATAVCRSEHSSTVDLMIATETLNKINRLFYEHDHSSTVYVSKMEEGEKTTECAVMEIIYEKDVVDLEFIRGVIATEDLNSEFDGSIHRVYQTLCHKWFWDQNGEYADLPEPANISFNIEDGIVVTASTEEHLLSEMQVWAIGLKYQFVISSVSDKEAHFTFEDEEAATLFKLTWG
jgi:hypothetical protein